MSVVPSTVDSIREQIKEAIKLKFESTSLYKVLGINDEWNKYTTFTNNLIKVFYNNDPSVRVTDYFSKKTSRADQIHLVILPKTNNSNYELITSKVIESIPQLINRDVITPFMDISYRDKLINIQCGDILMGTSDGNISNNIIYIEAKLTVTYILNG